MRILAIETSCDETAISIIESRGAGARRRFRVLSNIVSSQAKLHAAFGGVVPNLASREHQKNLVPILIAALKEAKLYKIQKKKNLDPQIEMLLTKEPELLRRVKEKIISLKVPAIDAIAVTHGPGLEPALWVGVNFAKTLSTLWKKRLIPVNHMEGHIYSGLIKKDSKGFILEKLKLPALTLLVSGGHTELVIAKKLGKYSIIGETVDDASGEAFDKVAKMLSLGYPGGPAISKVALEGNERGIPFPRPMINANNLDFSFSGLKTSVLYYLRDNKKYKTPDVAASFQQAVVDVLVSKTLRALAKYKARTLILGGGVAANKLLRKTLREKISADIHLYLPEISLTGDNALMIALAAFFRKPAKNLSTIRADGNLRLS